MLSSRHILDGREPLNVTSHRRQVPAPSIRTLNLIAWREPAGFADLTSFSIESPFQLPFVDDYLAFLRAGAAPVRAVLSRVSQPGQDAAWQEIRERLSASRMDDAWVGPNTLRLTVGRK